MYIYICILIYVSLCLFLYGCYIACSLHVTIHSSEESKTKVITVPMKRNLLKIHVIFEMTWERNSREQCKKKSYLRKNYR